jgi:hypothetical protein
MVIGEQVAIAQALRRLSIVAEDYRVRADFGLGEDYADLYDPTPSSNW